MYDVAVIGVGSMGAFACLELAQRGLRVVGLDRWTPPHTAGSHAGETRVYREAYAEHPDYVPLAVLAGTLWEAHGGAAQRALLTRCGQLNVGRPTSPLLAGITYSAALHNIPILTVEADELQRRFPMLRVLDGEIGVLEPGAGWVDVNTSLRYALSAARACGAELRLNTPVHSWVVEGNSVTLHLNSGEVLKAARLVVCAGAWNRDLLPTLDLPLRVVRKVLAWARPRERFAVDAANLPVLSFADKILYTFPSQNGLFKMAVHATAREIFTDPEQVAPPAAEDFDELVAEVSRHLSPLLGEGAEVRERIAVSKTCLYTMTPDEHFVLDRVPGDPVWYAAGFSGHGFKFAPAIGRVLTELCLDEQPSAPIRFLSADRFNSPTFAGQPEAATAAPIS